MVTRLDLDGTYSPVGLVTKILQAEPNIKIPVPIEELAYQLDISEIKPLQTQGFEGGLITDEARSFGGILFKEGASRQRQRFTIGHELCHFLIPYHKPPTADGFLCDGQAMRQWDTKARDRAIRMEVEANLFSSLILMPPPILRLIINGKKYSTLATVIEIHEHFDVSKEAAARAYAEYNPEPIAVVIAKDGRLLRIYKNREFPWITIEHGAAIPEKSLLHSYRNFSQPSDSDETEAEYWIETDWGEPIPKMYEQIMLQMNGFAMIQLKILKQQNDEYDPNEDMTAKQRYQREQERRNK